MWSYIVRRILLTIPIVLGVLLITMLLFSFVARDPARAWAGKYATEAQLEGIRAKMGLDKPRWVKWSVPVRQVEVAADGRVTVTTPWKHGLDPGDRVVADGFGGPAAGANGTFPVATVGGPKIFTYQAAAGPAAAPTSTAPAGTAPAGTAPAGTAPAGPAAGPAKVADPAALAGARVHEAGLGGRLASAFDSQLFDILTFRIYALPSLRYNEPIWDIVKRRYPASMAIQVPAFLIALGLQLALSLWAAARRGRWQDYGITVVSVLILSVPALSAYLFAQWWLGMRADVFPVAGWESEGLQWVRFAALPIFVSVFLAIGGGTRLYRTVVLDEIYSDYVRTARAKGVAGREVLFTHVLRNALIPVITNTVTALPNLILGALLLERIFQIPGLGSFMVEALLNNDRTVVMGMTFALSIVYCVLILVSDILYTLVNPQVSLK